MKFIMNIISQPSHSKKMVKKKKTKNFALAKICNINSHLSCN